MMFNLGAFFGNVARGFTQPVKAPPAAQQAGGPAEPPARKVVRQDVQEKVVETPTGPVTLRRTVTDEIEPHSGS